MKLFIFCIASLAVTSAFPGVLISPHSAVHPYTVSSQYHAQDELGQYSYGYIGGPSAKHEVKTLDGVTRGGYSYIDANGVLQTVHYVSDPINGFRVAATNLPVAPEVPATPEIAVAPAVEAPIKEVTVVADEIKETAPEIIAQETLVEEPKIEITEVKAAAPIIAAPIHTAHIASAPIHTAHIAAAPIHTAHIASAPISPLYSSLVSPLAYYNYAPAMPYYSSSQYHAQDELGQYSYGYSGGPSTKHEVKTYDGITRGGYSYVDANGVIQTVHYVSDPINGFRVAATNLPVANQLPVQDLPEVAAAKAEHLAAHAQLKSQQ